MTENEKAATFIGWYPGQICEICALTDGCYDCDLEIGTHIRKVPDMSRPENYMRALEGGDFGYEMIYDPQLGDAAWWSVDIYRDHRGNRVALGESRIGRGDSVIQALAKLYDKEHSNG